MNACLARSRWWTKAIRALLERKDSDKAATGNESAAFRHTATPPRPCLAILLSYLILDFRVGAGPLQAK